MDDRNSQATNDLHTEIDAKEGCPVVFPPSFVKTPRRARRGRIEFCEDTAPRAARSHRVL